MLDATSKTLFHGLAQIPTLQRFASTLRHAPKGGFARRFIAGETVEEAIAAVADLPGKGLLLTLDYLGESVASADAAAAAAADYVGIIGKIVASGIERNISLKLTQLGLDVDRATAVDNMRRILEPADAERVLRPHRHGELALHRRDARAFSKRCGSRGTPRSAP